MSTSRKMLVCFCFCFVKSGLGEGLDTPCGHKTRWWALKNGHVLWDHVRSLTTSIETGFLVLICGRAAFCDIKKTVATLGQI